MGQGPNEPKTEKHIGTGPDSDKNDETVSSHGQSSANRIHAKDTEESEFVAGSSFGRFQIVRLLGRGGMGYVYLAFDSKLERQIALKVMRPDVARHQRERDRFIREARAAAKISSDHVVVVFDADEVDGVPYIAQQFLAGCTLDEYLKSKPQLTIPLISRFAREICEGLRVAHNSGMVHRDIKLSNLWVESPNQRIKILDFGLAYVEQSDEALRTIGAPANAATFPNELSR